MMRCQLRATKKFTRDSHQLHSESYKPLWQIILLFVCRYESSRTVKYDSFERTKQIFSVENYRV